MGRTIEGFKLSDLVSDRACFRRFMGKVYNAIRHDPSSCAVLFREGGQIKATFATSGISGRLTAEQTICRYINPKGRLLLAKYIREDLQHEYEQRSR